MKTTSLRARTLACALLATTAFCGLGAEPAAAQTPREHRALDANGVDLTHGDFVMAFVEGSIGSGDGELALVRTRIGSGNGSWHVSSGPHQWDLLYLIRSVGTAGTTISVNKDDRYELFNALGTLPTGSSLAAVGAEHHYRTADGTLVVFGDPTGSWSSTSTHCNGNPGQGNCSQLPLSIATPDGKSVGIGWEIWQSCSDELIDENNPEPDCSYWARIDSVSNSFGYRIAFTYASDGNSSSNGVPPPNTWQRRTSAALYNDAVSTTTPQASLSYSYPSTSIVDVTDTGGRVWRFSSDGLRITGIRRPGAASDTVTVSYGGVGSSVSSVTNEGVTTNYSRSVSGSNATMIVTNALSQVSTVVSDLVKGRPTSVTDPLSRTTAYQYDSSARLERVTQPEGNFVHYTYDSRGNVIATTAVPKGGGGATIVTSASYDPTCANPATCNQPDSVTDARGNITDYTYDATHGGVLTVTGPAPAAGAVRPQTRYAYTLVNGEYRLTAVSQCRTTSSCAGGADEVKTIVAYDTNGNVTSTSTGSGDGALTATGAMTWDAVGNLLTVDGPLPGPEDISRVRYNAARQAIGAVSPDPDGNGGPLRHRAVRASYTDGLLTRVEQGNVDSQSDADWAAFVPAQAVETGYDSNARPVTGKLTAGGTAYALTQTRYDALGRPECTAARMNPAAFASLPASACSPGTQGSFGPDRIVKAIYDAAGQAVQVKTALGTADEANEVTSTYTDNGMIETVTDAENNKTSYEYDGHDRLARTRFPDPAKGAGTSSTSDYEQPTYESLAGGTRTSNLVASFRNRADETTAFAYDGLGRMTSKDRPGSELDVAYSYDLLGRLTSAATSAQTLAFAWDALGRNLSQTDGSRTYSSQYDLAGRRTRLTHPDGFFVDQDHLVTGEMVKIRENGATSGIGVLATYGYDDLGRRSSLTFGNGESASYQYDAVSRLSQLSRDLGGSAATNDLTLTFAYNPASQIVSTNRSNDLYAWTGHGNGTTSTTANGLNQLAGWNGTLTYDAKGNISSDGTRNYTYDSENRLADTSSTIPYYYDPLGRLAGAGSPIAIHYENYVDGLIAEKLPGSSGVSFRHVFGPGTDEPIVWYVGPGTTDRRFLHADERGSIVAVTDASAGLLAINRYDEYGKTQTSGTNYGRFLYTGQRYFGAIGLYYYKNRFYRPDLVRFMQTDPGGYDDGMNLYIYVGGDPVNATDPSGKEACTGSRINLPGPCNGALGGGLSGFSTAGFGPRGGLAGSGEGKDTANNPGKGSFKNVAIGMKDTSNTLGKGTFNNFEGPSLGQCQVDPEVCMLTRIGGPNTIPTLQTIVHTPSIRSAIHEAFRRSNPSGPTSGKNEWGFWIGQKGSEYFAYPMFIGKGFNIWPYSNHPKGTVIFFHTHPFTMSEGRYPGMDKADLGVAQRNNIMLIALSWGVLHWADYRR